MFDQFAMFIGHFGPAEMLLSWDKTLPVLPIAIGVSYPDLIWPLLVYLKKEKVRVDPDTPLQKEVKFTHFPYSHSLVLSSLLTIIPAILFAVFYKSAWVGVVFLLAAMSHWLLDAIVHRPDLPVLGFGEDKKVGLALWKYPKFAFFFEYAFFAVFTMVFMPMHTWPGLLIGSFSLHMFNANSFFGFTKKNPTKTPNLFATLALVGFVAAIYWFTAAFSR